MTLAQESGTLAGAHAAAGGSGAGARLPVGPPSDAERRLAAFAEASEEIAWELDRSGFITYVSPAVERHLGYQPIELVGQSWQTIMPTSEHERGAALIEATAADAARWFDQDYVFRTKAGHLRPMWSTGLTELDGRGAVVGFAGTLRPVPPDRAARDGQIRQVIEDIIGWRLIQPVFQPISDLVAGDRVAVEALSRFPLHAQRSPAQLFGHAAALGLGADLELAAVGCALAEAAELPERLAVSINVSPDTLVSGRLPALITGSAIDPRRIILEITEQAAVGEYAPVVAALDPLRAQGCRLAVDDAGAGYASFKHILALAPELIKLDRFLVTGIATDPARRALIRSVVGFGREVGAEILAEGIEDADEAATVRRLGVRYGQGYHIAPPCEVSQLLEMLARPY
jgi:PAS domain S-box-containing protein